MTESQQHQEIPLSDRPTGWCPKCKVYVAFRQQQRQMVWPEVWMPPFPGRTSYGRRPEGPKELWTTIWSCQNCNRTIVVHEQHEQTPEGDMVPTRVYRAWPERGPRELHSFVPEAVRSVYTEASVAEDAGALRAAAVMYRAAVEELCADKGATGRNLEDKIKSLAQRDVSGDLVADLHEARLLGNWSIHQGLTFSAEEVADVALLIDNACFEIYVQPAERQAMREARKARREAQDRR